MDKYREQALNWYRQGIRDSETAQKNSLNGDYEVACFLYQQAAEKILKSFLYLMGESPVIGHSTLKLAQRCSQYKKEFDTPEIKNACRELDTFYVPTRYPNGLPGGAPFEYYTEIHSQRGREAYENIYSFVKKFLESENSR